MKAIENNARAIPANAFLATPGTLIASFPAVLVLHRQQEHIPHEAGVLVFKSMLQDRALVHVHNYFLQSGNSMLVHAILNFRFEGRLCLWTWLCRSPLHLTTFVSKSVCFPVFSCVLKAPKSHVEVYTYSGISHGL